MKQFKGYGEAKVYSGAYKALPPGGYICGIREAYTEVSPNGTPEVLVIKYDIADGEYKSYFQDQFLNSTLENKKYKGVYRVFLPAHELGDAEYNERDEKALRSFKTFIKNIEDSNKGYSWDWDETKLRFKYFGGVFGEKEYSYNGYEGVYTALKYTVPTGDIINGNFKIPERQKLNNNKTAESAQIIEVNDVGEMPF